jgi:hypothetical protein
MPRTSWASADAVTAATLQAALEEGNVAALCGRAATPALRLAACAARAPAATADADLRAVLAARAGTLLELWRGRADTLHAVDGA